MARPSCQTCAYFTDSRHLNGEYIDENGDTVSPGQCRYNPPQIIVEYIDDDDGNERRRYRNLFPQVLPFHWCAQHPEFDPERRSS